MKRKFSEMNSEVCYSEDFNIFKACKFANVDYIIKYIEQNGDVNLTDKNLNSLLHYSVMFGDQYTTRLLLMNGADINKYNIMGFNSHLAELISHLTYGKNSDATPFPSPPKSDTDVLITLHLECNKLVKDVVRIRPISRRQD